ncbi:unnamed protein product [Phaedon cochleariae]|uniref:Transmembrane protein 26 n=1 Tax=Phaedon cochleariae TaxID=80249 RepID=A0A9N9SCF3_PHACE|nr:unnamed protein product [Phaedon cochleariae]
MGKHRILRAIFIRIIFIIHSLIAIGQVVYMKDDRWYWYLCAPLILMILETVVTLTLTKNLEWSWFCPSVFLYLTSIVPAIWLLELDKVDRRMKALEKPMNITTGAQFKEISTLIGGVQITLPEISMSTETWITLIEQFLMLILIIGRWMLPKGDLTRDQLSQLLLVYIGTAADIIEFFDSFKDEKVASEPVLVLLTLSIWSWSLMQFTVVLTATKSRKSRLATTSSTIEKSDGCCTIDVCGIILNITLQDAPFLAFRLLLIAHYKIITYMNIFFTCKNTLVITLQIYRLYVVYTETHKKSTRTSDVEMMSNISIISSISRNDLTFEPRRRRRPSNRVARHDTTSTRRSEDSNGNDSDESGNVSRPTRKNLNSRKDTGYSTASSQTTQTSTRNNLPKTQSKRSNTSTVSNGSENQDPESRRMMKQKLRRTDRETTGRRKIDETVSEESDANYVEEDEIRRERRDRSRDRERRGEKDRNKERAKGRDKKFDRQSTATLSDDSSD